MANKPQLWNVVIFIAYKKVIFKLKNIYSRDGASGDGGGEEEKWFFSLTHFEGQRPVLHSFNSILRPWEILEIKGIIQSILFELRWDQLFLKLLIQLVIWCHFLFFLFSQLETRITFWMWDQPGVWKWGRYYEKLFNPTSN